jgi:hypothetical protein
MAFLTHYQLPIRYDTVTEILTSFKQSKSTHISDHIHEWQRRQCHIKLELPDQLLAEWFTKSFVNEIGKEISMGGVITEEKTIIRAQYLDLVYSKMGTLYDLLPDLPHPNTSNTSTAPAASHATDGVIGTSQAQSNSVSSTNPKSASSNVQNVPSPATPTGKTSEVNVVQCTPAEKTNLKKGEARIRREKIIIKPSKLKILLFMTEISANPTIRALSMVMIITRRIVQDVLRLLSSSREPQNPLHRLSCPNPSRLNNRLNWSFMTNHLLLQLHMF